MQYRILSSDDRRLVLAFSMPERPVLITLLALVSLVCLVIGLAYALSPENPGDSLRGLSFTAFGLFCFCAIFLFAAAYTTAFPARMVFDNDKGCLELLDRGGTTVGVVPYAGIAGFSVCRGFNNRAVRYSAGVELARGGRWELYASQRRSRVDRFQQAVSAAVRLKAASAAVASAPAPLAAERDQDGTLRLAWSRRAHPAQLILSLVILGSFFGALVGTRPFTSGAASYVLAVVFGVFFLAVAGVSVLRTVGETMEVRLGKGVLEYRHRSLLARPRGFTRSLSQVAVVDFSMGFSRMPTAIAVLQPQEVEEFVRYRQGTFGPADVPGLIGFLRRLARIDVSALPLEQRLALAELIRETMSAERAAGH